MDDKTRKEEELRQATLELQLVENEPETVEGPNWDVQLATGNLIEAWIDYLEECDKHLERLAKAAKVEA